MPNILEAFRNARSWGGGVPSQYLKLKVLMRALLQPITLLGTAMIIACWIGLAFMLSIERQKSVEDSTQQLGNLASLFEDYVSRSVQSVDQTLLLVRENYQTDPDHFDLQRLSQLTQLAIGLTGQMTAIGSDGFSIGTIDTKRGSRVYLGDREYFSTLARSNDDQLVIGPPVMGRISKMFSIQFARRLVRPDGSFGGVIAASVDTTFIDKFFRNIDLGTRGTATLRGQDGVVRATYGFKDPSLGKVVMTPQFLDRLARQPSGIFWGGGAIDRVNRLVAYRVLDQYPLIVSVALAETDIFAPYVRHRNIYIAVLANMSLLALIVIFVSTCRQLRLDRSEALAREKSRELEFTVDRMSQGLSMFDGDARLVVWNDRFANMYGLSPEIVKRGTSFRSIIEFHKSKGNLDVDPETFISDFRLRWPTITA